MQSGVAQYGSGKMIQSYFSDTTLMNIQNIMTRMADMKEDKATGESGFRQAYEVSGI